MIDNAITLHSPLYIRGVIGQKPESVFFRRKTPFSSDFFSFSLKYMLLENVFTKTTFGSELNFTRKMFYEKNNFSTPGQCSRLVLWGLVFSLGQLSSPQVPCDFQFHGQKGLQSCQTPSLQPGSGPCGLLPVPEGEECPGSP